MAAPSPMIQSQAVTCQSGGTGVYVNWPAWFGELTELRIGMAAMARSPPRATPGSLKGGRERTSVQVCQALRPLLAESPYSA